MQRLKNISLTYSKITFFVSSLRATFQDPVLCGVIFEACMCSYPPALCTSRPRHLPPLSPNSIERRVFRATQGFAQSSLSSFVHWICRAVDYIAENKAGLVSLYNSATTPNLQTPLPTCFCRSTLLYKHSHARVTQEGILPYQKACLSRACVEEIVWSFSFAAIWRYISKTRRIFLCCGTPLSRTSDRLHSHSPLTALTCRPVSPDLHVHLYSSKYAVDDKRIF